MTTRRLLTLGAAVTAALVALGGTALAFSGDDATRTGTDDTVRTSAATTMPTTTFPLPSPAATIGRSAAEQAALAHVGGGTITHHTESETEHGRGFWEVEVTDARGAHTLYVDTTTGAVAERGTARTGSAAPTGGSAVRVDDRGGRSGVDDSGLRVDDSGRGVDGSGRHGGDDRSGRHGGDDDGPNHD
jgi:hypothetical protein